MMNLNRVPATPTTTGHTSGAKPRENPQNHQGKTNEPYFSTACFSCRTRHLKCDRRLPCSRCTDSGSKCTYVASRRGFNRTRQAVYDGSGTLALDDSRSNHTETGPPPTTDDSMTSAQTANLFSTSLAWHDQSSVFNTGQLDLSPNSVQSDFQPKSYPSFVQSSLADRCLSSFYRNFHAVHPFALPEQFLLRLVPEASIDLLLSSMRWVGSLYINMPSGTRVGLLEDAHTKISHTITPRDGFLVQAMIMLLVSLDGLCEFDKASKMLHDARQLAVEIGLHTRSFAALHGQSVPVLEESWRRTWWDLYVIDGMIAGLHRATNFALNDVQADAALPCEEWQYISGAIPTPQSFSNLEAYTFTGTIDNLSSFAYRVQSARTLGQLLKLPSSTEPDDQAFSRVEASLTNWSLHLPDSKRDAVAGDGSSDEIMFQALMLHHAMSILLHYPHSRLDSLAARNADSCAPDRPLTASGAVLNSHTRHVVAAADEISRLITHRAPLRSHTPFFTCAVVLASVVHLNQWVAVLSGDDEALREKVRLSIGALSVMSEVWRTAAVARGQVRGVAREIYEAKRKHGEGDGVSTEVDVWGGIKDSCDDIPLDGFLELINGR